MRDETLLPGDKLRKSEKNGAACGPSGTRDRTVWEGSLA